jgi:hypothetical protein
MSDLATLHAEVLGDPDSDLPRIAYADAVATSWVDPPARDEV